MAHRIKVEEIPHKNKDGSFSQTKKDYRVIDRTRSGRVEVGVASSRKAVTDLIAEYRLQVVQKHLSRNPDDLAFLSKNKLPIPKVSE